MRSKHLFNYDWRFKPEQVGDGVPDAEFEAVTIPHSNLILPHHSFDDAEYQFVSTYRKRFTLPEPLKGRRLYLDFDGAMLASTVIVNGHTFDEYRGGYTPFSFDITDYVVESGENLVTVHLDSTERKDIPPFGFVVDYLAFGGIYRDVWLRYVEPMHISNVFVKPQDVLGEGTYLEVDLHTLNQGSAVNDLMMSLKLLDGQGEGLKSMTAEVPGRSGEGVSSAVMNDLGAIELWSVNNPVLYHLEVTLLAGDTVLDMVTVRFGFRHAEFRDDGFYLNGQHLKLIGLNRHQTYPYIGAAAPARLQQKDADILKYELSLNIARTSHYPQSPYFLDRCDEIGLLVFEEIPGWQHIGDKEWQSLSLRDVRAMIERDWNHPSIILWGVRINESLDNTEFYKATNALAHQLDPTRQTGGVRYWQYSEFLEDVYTFNDFSNSVQEPVQTPHMVTEFNGHMFPTKSFDNEERLMEHALRHARIQDKQFGMRNVAGAIGWCAFDYNTHREFGSGDRICYHGVMDIFRLPKYAAYVYASQVSPHIRPVLQAATIWTRGDRSEGGNDPLIVLSNCDEIEAFIGETLHGKYAPDRETFPNLPYPPFKISIEGAWGSDFDQLTLIGYVDGDKVAEQKYPLNPQPTRLILEADDSEINADGIDMTRLVFKVVDEFGNRLPYATKVITFENSGPAQLIGENPFPLVGGQACMYVKAGYEAGEFTVTASTDRLASASVTVKLVKP